MEEQWWRWKRGSAPSGHTCGFSRLAFAWTSESNNKRKPGRAKQVGHVAERGKRCAHGKGRAHGRTRAIGRCFGGAGGAA